MILPGHLAAGYITAYSALAVLNPSFSPAEHNFLLLFGTLCGDLPDIDVFYFMLRKKNINPDGLEKHRTFVTHAPIVWLVLGLGIYFVFNNPLIQFMGLLVWLGSWSHLVFDSIETGVMWLWPFSTKQFALSKGGENIDTVSSPKWSDLFRGYFKLVTCYIEIFVTIIALTLLILS